MRPSAVSRSRTIFWLPITRISCPAPEAYGPSWLPLAEAATSCPASVTAWTLPTMKSGAAPSLRISRICVCRSIWNSWLRRNVYFPDSMRLLKTPASSRVFDLPECTSEPAGMRSSTALRASEALSTTRTSKFRSRNLSARDASCASEAAVVKSNEPVGIKPSPNKYSLDKCWECKVYFGEVCLVNRWEVRSIHEGPGSAHAARADRRLAESPADEPRAAEPARGTPGCGGGPVLAGVRAPLAPPVLRRARASDERDGRATAGQPEWTHADRGPTRGQAPDRPRHPPRQPARRPRHSYGHGPGGAHQSRPHIRCDPPGVVLGTSIGR